MKRLLTAAILFLSLSLLFLQSTSFTTATITNDALFSNVPEDQALLAITYNEHPQFWITNNTESIIYIEQLEIIGGENYAIDYATNVLMPGSSEEFTLIGEVESLIGRTLTVLARWDHGEAVISSTLPTFIVEEVALPPLTNETLKEDEKQTESLTDDNESSNTEDTEENENSKTEDTEEKEDSISEGPGEENKEEPVIGESQNTTEEE